MIAVTVELPDELHRMAANLAETRGVTIGEVLKAATVAHLGAAPVESNLAAIETRAARGAGRTLREILDLVPDAEPEERDRLPPGHPFSRSAACRNSGSPGPPGTA